MSYSSHVAVLFKSRFVSGAEIALLSHTAADPFASLTDDRNDNLIIGTSPDLARWVRDLASAAFRNRVAFEHRPILNGWYTQQHGACSGDEPYTMHVFDGIALPTNNDEVLAFSWFAPSESPASANPVDKMIDDSRVFAREADQDGPAIDIHYVVVPSDVPEGKVEGHAETCARTISWAELFRRATPAVGERPSGPTLVLHLVQEHCRELLRCLVADPSLLAVLDHRRFEEVIATLLSDVGFDVVELTPPGPDGGKDIVIECFDRATDVVATYLVECKHWTSGRKIGLDVALNLSDLRSAVGADGAVVVATSGFSPTVLDLHAEFERSRVYLRDRRDIQEWTRVWERSFGAPERYCLDPQRLLSAT